MREAWLAATLQSAGLFFAVWLVFRLAPAIPANVKAWVWRLAFLKPILGLLPFAAVSLRVLPASAPTVRGPIPPALLRTLPSASPPVPNGLSASSPSASSPSASSPSPSVDPLLTLWLAGAASVAGLGRRNRAQARRIVRRAVPVSDAALHGALGEFSSRAGLRRVPRLLVSPRAEGPMLVGGPILSCGRGTAIVLPDSILEPRRQGDARLMLAHEVAHLARRDLEWFAAIWVVQSLFFFNPLVWVAAHAARLDHESATDEAAVRLAETPIQAYAEMLLRATVAARGSLVPGIVPMAESYRSIHQRVKAMRHFPSSSAQRRPASLGRRSAIGALVLATAAFLPLYRLANAAPPQGPGARSRETLLYTAPPSPKNPFKYSVYRIGDRFWIQVEKGGTKRRFLWEETTPSESVPSGVTGTDPDRLILNFAQVDARDAVRELFRVAKKSFVMDVDFQGQLSISAKNVPFETLLESLVKQVGGSYRIENGTYRFSGKPQTGRP